MPIKPISKEVQDVSAIDDMTGVEVPNISLIKNTGKVEVTSDKYVILDSEALAYIKERLSRSDMGRLIEMCDMVSGDLNLITDKTLNIPHTNITLRMCLDYSKGNYIMFMKKLYELNVIFYFKAFDQFTGKSVTWIMLNPTLARKKKVFDEKVNKVFNDLAQSFRQGKIT
jgi:hypothetical protein